MPSTTTARRIVVQCAWCDEKQLIPSDWAGRVIKCINCGIEGRAYGYLTAPQQEPTTTRKPIKQDSIDDGCGGLISAMIFVVGLWMVAASIVMWIW